MPLRFLRRRVSTSLEDDRFGQVVRTVRWVELLGVMVGMGIQGALMASDSPPTSSIGPWQTMMALILATVMAAYNLWAEAMGKYRLIDRSTVLGVSIDAAYITLLLTFTDGTDSWFLGLFAVLIVCVAVRTGIRGALLTAAASSLLAGLSEALNSTSPTTALDVLTHVTYLFLLAWVAGELTEAFWEEANKRARSELEKERMQGDLEAARRVQHSLLPAEVPVVTGLEVAVRYEPAGAVGGDIYDFLPVGPFGASGPEEMGFVVADVSGHSLPAALLVAAAKSALHDASAFPPVQMMGLVNSRMLRDAAADQFLTLVYARIDARTGRLRIVNAGHPPPLLLRSAGKPALLGECGLVLGIISSADWSETAHQLEAGDAVALYSDGLMERRMEDGVFAGLDDWLEALAGYPGCGSADDIADYLWERADILGPRHDDASLLVIRYLGDGARKGQAAVEAVVGGGI